jgi:hypothetical protein
LIENIDLIERHILLMLEISLTNHRVTKICQNILIIEVEVFQKEMIKNGLLGEENDLTVKV